MTETGPAICVHLQPLLALLRERGSKVVGVDREMWSNCELNVTLDCGPGRALAAEVLEITPGVKLWHNDDRHYAIENGLFCESCRHSLSWPAGEGES